MKSYLFALIQLSTNDPISLSAAIVAAINSTYSILLAIFRHSSSEGRGLQDTVNELILNSSGILAVAALNRNNKNDITFSITIIVASLLLLHRSYNKYVHGNKYLDVNLSDKIYIVTGSNSGIGFETANELARMGGTVILACRSVEKANIAKDDIIKRSKCKPENVITLELDLCSFSSIRSFVHMFHELKLPLHCLINNAGLMMQQRTLTK
eukprot:gene12331-25939_t